LATRRAGAIGRVPRGARRRRCIPVTDSRVHERTREGGSGGAARRHSDGARARSIPTASSVAVRTRRSFGRRRRLAGRAETRRSESSSTRSAWVHA